MHETNGNTASGSKTANIAVHSDPRVIVYMKQHPEEQKGSAK